MCKYLFFGFSKNYVKTAIVKAERLIAHKPKAEAPANPLPNKKAAFPTPSLVK